LSEDPTQDEGQEPQEDATADDAQGTPEPVEADDHPDRVPADADVGPSAPPEAPDEETAAPSADAGEPQADPAPAEEVPAEDSDVAEAAEAAPGEDAPADDTPVDDAPAAEKKAKDVAPGADLEPLLIEEERELSAEERAALEAEREEAERAAQAETDVVDDGPALREGASLDLAPDARVQATGKRKTAVARVVLAKGGGDFVVNKKPLDEYFPRSLHQTIARQALVTSGYSDQVDVRVRVHGGGVSGQADAVRHGIARALVEIDPELRGELKRRGMLTRDARAKERRKAGLKKARKRPQFSKR
jgi:small subunit ribosomal protein S9